MKSARGNCNCYPTEGGSCPTRILGQRMPVGRHQGGFRVGFTGDLGTLRSSVRNTKSVDEQPQVVQDYQDKELASGRNWEVGTLAEASAMHIHRSYSV